MNLTDFKDVFGKMKGENVLPRCMNLKSLPFYSTVHSIVKDTVTQCKFDNTS